MAKRGVSEFLQVLGARKEWPDELTCARTLDAFAASVVKLGAKEGYKFSRADVEPALVAAVEKSTRSKYSFNAIVAPLTSDDDLEGVELELVLRASPIEVVKALLGGGIGGPLDLTGPWCATSRRVTKYCG